MASRGNDIRFNIGFDVDTANLKQALQEVQNLTKSDWIKLHPEMDNRQVIESLVKVKSDAKEVELALKESFNPQINAVNIDNFMLKIKNSVGGIKELKTSFDSAGASGKVAFLKLEQQILSTNTSIQKTNTFIDRMADTFAKTIKWNIASSAINRITGSIQEAYGYVKALDGSLNDIKIVTQMSADEMDRFADRANKAAQSLGRATTDYTDVAKTFYQQGLSDEEVAARSDLTLKVANASGLSAENASEYVTAVLNAYKVGSEEAEKAMDILANVGAHTASSLSELSEGMSKVASTANTMGVSEEQLAASLATVIQTTRQDASSVGTAFKTIYMRISDIKAGTEDAEVSLGNYTQQMADLGYNVLDSTGELRDLGAVVEEIGGNWSNMSREQQVALARTMAGTRQANNLLALFDNWGEYEKAIGYATDATGTLQQQQDTYMESTEAHLKTMKASWEDVFDSLLDTDFINGFADIFSSVGRNLASFIDSLNGGKGVLLALGSTALNVFSKQIGTGLAQTITKTNDNKVALEHYQAVVKNSESFSGKNINDTYINALAESARVRAEYEDKLSESQKTQLDIFDKIVETQAKESYELEEEKAKLEALTQESENFKDVMEKVTEIKFGENITLTEGQINRLKEEIKKINSDWDKIANKPGSIYNKNAKQNDNIKFANKIIQDGYQSETSNFNKFKGLLSNDTSSKLEKTYTDFQNNSGDTTKAEAFKRAWFNAIDEIRNKLNESNFDEQIEIHVNNEEYEQSKGRIKELENQIEELEAKIQELQSQQQKPIINSAQIAEANQRVMSAVGGLGQVASAITSLQNIGSIWSNDDLSTGEKILQTISLAATGIAMLGSGMKALMSLKLEDIALTGKSIVVGLAKLVGIEAEIDANGRLAISAATAASAETAAMWPLYAILAVVTAIVVAAAVLTNEVSNTEKEIKKWNETTETLSENIKDVNEELNEVSSKVDSLQNLKEELDGCVSGTKEWRDVLQEINSTTLELLTNYPALLNAADAVNDDGTIDIQKLQAYLEQQEKEINKAQYVTNVGSSYAKTLSAEEGIKEKGVTSIASNLLLSNPLMGGFGGYEAASQMAESWIEEILNNKDDYNNKEALEEYFNKKEINIDDNVINSILSTIDNLNKAEQEQEAVVKVNTRSYLDANEDISEGASSFLAGMMDVNKKLENYDAGEAAQKYIDTFLSGDGYQNAIIDNNGTISYEIKNEDGSYESKKIESDTIEQWYQASEALSNVETAAENLSKYLNSIADDENKVEISKLIESMFDENGELDLSGIVAKMTDEQYQQFLDGETLYNIFGYSKNDWNAVFKEYEEVISQATGIILSQNDYISKKDAYREENKGKTSTVGDDQKEYIKRAGIDTSKMTGEEQINLNNVLDNLSTKWTESGLPKDGITHQLKNTKEVMSLLGDKGFDFLNELDKISPTAIDAEEKIENISKKYKNGLDKVSQQVIDSYIQSSIDLYKNTEKSATDYTNYISEKLTPTEDKTVSVSEFRDVQKTYFEGKENLSEQESIEVSMALREALIGVAEQYDNTADDIERYRAALKGSNKEAVAAAENALIIATRSGELANKYDLSAEEIEYYADALKEKEGYEKESAEHLADMAKAQLRYNRALEKTKSKIKDWKDAIDAANKSGGILDPTTALEMQDAYGDLLDIDGSNLSNAFLTSKENAEKLEAAIKGDKEAYQFLEQEAQHDIIVKLHLEDDELTQGLLNTIQELENSGMTDVEIRAALNTPDFKNQLNEWLAQVGATAENASALMAQCLSVDATVKPVEGTQEEQVGWDYQVVQDGASAGVATYIDPQGNQHTATVYQPNWKTVATPAMATKTITGVGVEVTDVNGLTTGGDVKFDNSSTGHASSGGSGGGGGGGGSKGGSTKKSDKYVSQKDPYHDVNIKVEKLSKQYDKLGKAQEKLTGKNLTKNLLEQLTIIEKQKDAQEEKLKIAQEEAKKLKDELINSVNKAGLGITISADDFDKDGNLKEGVYDKIYGAYDAAMEKFSDRELTEAEEEEKSKLEKQFGFVTDYLSKLEDTVNSVIPECQEKLQDLTDTLVSQSLETLKVRLELELDIKEALSTLNDFETRFVSGIKKDSALYNATLQQGVIEISKSPLIAAKDTLETIYQQYLDDIEKNGFENAVLREELKSKYSDYASQLTEYADAYDSIKDSYLDAIGDFTDAQDAYIENLELANDLLEHQKNIYELLYGNSVKYYDSLADSGYYEKILTNDESKVKQLKELVNIYRGYYTDATKSGDEELIEKWGEALKSKMTELNSATEQWGDHLKEQLENAIDAAMAEWEKQLTNGVGFSLTADELSLMNSDSDIYYDDVNRAYQLQALANKWQEAIDNEDSLTSQQKLNNLMQEQLEYLEQKGELTEYDIQRAEKEYEIALKQVALQDAQQNKTKMRLKRDANGNYSYQYVSDNDQVNQAKQELTDLQNELYNFDKDAYKENQNTIISLVQDAQDKIAEIYKDTTLSTEEKEAEKAKIVELYEKQIQKYITENGSIEKNLMQSAAEEYEKLYSTTFGGIDTLIQETGSNAQAMIKKLKTEGIATTFNSMAEKVLDAANTYKDALKAFESGEYTLEINSSIFSEQIETDISNSSTALKTISDMLERYSTLLENVAGEDGLLARIVKSLEAPLDETPYASELSDSVKLDSGGYTGSWGSEGRIATLHEKELVLNASDTENILSAVELVRDVVGSLNTSVLSNAKSLTNLRGLDYSTSAILNSNSENIEQTVYIDAKFEGKTEADQITQALNNLTNIATQRAFSNKR